jgi:small subunit ribosomal protein S9
MPVVKKNKSDQIEFKGLGRRKSSIARVVLTSGTGKATANGVDFEKYFPSKIILQDINQPLALTENLGKFDIKAKTEGGGFTGQAGAIRLGIARALLQVNAEYKTILKKQKMLTRDSRMKERKKP